VVFRIMTLLTRFLHYLPNANLLPCTLSVSSQGTNLAAARRLKIGALLDTGSLAGDFVSQRLVDDFRLVSKTAPHPSLVCSGLNNQCVDLHKKTAITVSFINEITLK